MKKSKFQTEGLTINTEQKKKIRARETETLGRKSGVVAEKLLSERREESRLRTLATLKFRSYR